MLKCEGLMQSISYILSTNSIMKLNFNNLIIYRIKFQKHSHIIILGNILYALKA